MNLRTGTIAATVALTTALSAGCGTDPLDERGWVGTWAMAGSAVGVYAHGYDPIGRADGHVTFPDTACPLVADDGTTLTITGGCTDSTGTEWRGTATVARAADGSRALTMDGYGRINDPAFASTVSGTLDLHRIDASHHSFTSDLVQAGGVTVSVHYGGTVDGDYDARTTWNGSGSVSRDGIVEPTGGVRVSTVDEVVDDSVCSGQPVSGTTTIQSDDHSAVVTYDGATACDSAKAARLTYDGADAGLIEGIYCGAVAPGATRGSAPLTALACFGAVAVGVVARRRRA